MENSAQGHSGRRGEHLPLLGTVGILLSLIGLYSLLSDDMFGILDSVIFPGWKRILAAAWESRAKMLEGLWSSLLLLVPAFTTSILAGISIGILVGMHPRVKRVLMPLFRMANPIPANILIPYLIAIMPSFWLSSYSVITIGVFWPVLIGTLQGVVMLEPRWVDNARCLGLKGQRLIFKVVLPGALPHIFGGIGTGLISSFVLLTVAEMFGATSGLGFFIQYYVDFGEYPRVLAGIVFLSITVVAIMAIYDGVRRHFLGWMNKR